MRGGERGAVGVGERKGEDVSKGRRGCTEGAGGGVEKSIGERSNGNRRKGKEKKENRRWKRRRIK